MAAVEEVVAAPVRRECRSDGGTAAGEVAEDVERLEVKGGKTENSGRMGGYGRSLLNRASCRSTRVSLGAPRSRS